MKDPIIITGIPRSGLSMVAGITFLCGAYGGVLSPPNKQQRRQLYENPIIVEHLIDKQLTDVSYLKSIVTGAFRQAKEKVWFVKHSKILLQWKVWHEAYPNAKWVFVRRKGEDIVHSCMNTSYMDDCQTEDEWVNWVKHRLGLMLDMRNATDNVWDVWPQKIIDGRFYEIEHCIYDLCLPWKEQDVIKLITPALYSEYKRSNNGKSNGSGCYCHPW